MQLSIFDIETLPGMACHQPTRRNPDGRKGTYAGYLAHYKAKEAPCAECKLASSEYERVRYSEKREENIAYRKKYRSENPDKILAYNKEYKRRNADKVLAYNREYYQRNSEKAAEWRRKRNQRRRARKLSLPTDRYTHEDITRAHGTVCYLCNSDVDIALPSGSPISPHIDHVHPMSCPECPGDILSNVRWTHASCNLTKGAKKVSELTLPFPAPSGNAY